MMTGRNFELWQPILALAAWMQDQGADDLLALTQTHALATIEATKVDQTPEADVILLQVLAAKIKEGQVPSASDVLEAARDVEADLFRKWGAVGVGRRLSQYGIKSRSSGDRRYRDVTLADLRRIELHYGIDLGLGSDENNDPDLLTVSVQSVQSVQINGADT